jgi:hypothetical protein
VGLNIAVLIYGAISLAKFDKGCNKPVDIYMAVNIAIALLNLIFSIYLFRIVHGMDTRDDHQLFVSDDPNEDPGDTSKRALKFFLYDPVFACYILLYLGMFAVSCYSIELGTECHSAMGEALWVVGVLNVVYLCVCAFLFLVRISMGLFKEMSRHFFFWCIPCLWPCLILGCAADAFEQAFGGDENRPVARAEKKPDYKTEAHTTAAEHHAINPASVV